MNSPNKRMPHEDGKVREFAKGGLYVAPNGVCKISTFDKEEKSQMQSFEEALREEHTLLKRHEKCFMSGNMNFSCQKRKSHFGKCSKDMGKHLLSIQMKSNAPIQRNLNRW